MRIGQIMSHLMQPEKQGICLSALHPDQITLKPMKVKLRALASKASFKVLERVLEMV